MTFQCYDYKHRNWWTADDRNRRILLGYDNQWYYHHGAVMHMASLLTGEAALAMWEARKNQEETVEIDENHLEEAEALVIWENRR